MVIENIDTYVRVPSVTSYHGSRNSLVCSNHLTDYTFILNRS